MYYYESNLIIFKMPRVIDFKIVGEFKNVSEYNDYKIELYNYGITNSNRVLCTMCEGNHKMKVQYSSCSEQSCNEVTKCPKRYKLTICESQPDIEKQKCILYQFGRHNSLENSKIQRGLSVLVKSLIDGYINDIGIMTPKKILIRLLKIQKKARVANANTIDIVPSLSQIKNYLVYQRNLLGNLLFLVF